MPPFFDRSQLQNAITARALPALERLAANADRLDRSLNSRFESDEPPPYFSSSESDEEEVLFHPVLARPREAVIQENKALLKEPLNDRELRSVVETLTTGHRYEPGRRFRAEAFREEELLVDFFGAEASREEARPPWKPSLRVNSFLKGRIGHQKRAIVARRNIRKRWQRLGIWNSEWGIPDRVNAQPNDNTNSWKWKWQSDVDPPPFDTQHPISRAVELRKGMPAGESAPPPPRSHLNHDASASEAESFIISRPWFMYSVEQMEFHQRMSRIPQQQWGNYSEGEDDQVKKWWKQRGDYKSEWQVSGRLIPGWKWRHESPSPEPEDLTPLLTDEMDFTPSEIDAFEAIPPPTPQPARQIPPSTERGRFLFGPDRKREEEAASNLPEPAEVEHESISGVEQQPTETPPRRRGRPRRTQQAGGVQQTNPAPVRRSVRIASRTADLPPPPAQVTRTRRTMAAETVTPRKERGRSRKTEGGVSKPAAPPAKRGRKPNNAKTAAAAAALDGEEPGVAQGAGKRERGRPRRTK